MKPQDLAQLWAELSRHVERHPGATPEQIAAAERDLGCALPEPLKALYAYSDGLSFVGGDLNIHPLQKRRWRVEGPRVPNPFKPGEFFDNEGETTALVWETKFLRECKWHIPPELLVFADNLAEHYYTIWLPRPTSRRFNHPVIEFGEGSGDRDGWALVGTDIFRFLYSQTLYLFLDRNPTPQIIDALELPDEVRRAIDTPELLPCIRLWVDPEIPDPRAEPFDRPTGIAQLRQLLGTAN